MSMAARKEQPQPTNASTGQQAEIIPMMPRISRRLQSLISQESSKVSSSQLRMSLISLHATLPAGAFSFCQSIIRRSGKGFGLPTYCMFCEAKPPKDIPGHRTDLRRRWQALHLAMHIKKGDTPDNFEVHHGDLGRT
jgi:hypothetical protein